jgi:hypothetical protein
VPYPISRILIQGTLGFDALSPNSIDAVSDRDFIAEVLFAATMIGTHLSRLAEDLIIYGSSEFGFVQFGEGYTSGSSMMPQKRNPDALELARGSGGAHARQPHHAARDAQGTAVELQQGPAGRQARSCSMRPTPCFSSCPRWPARSAKCRFRPERMRAALSSTMMATDLADYLVRKGATFREAHGAVGQLVRESETTGRELQDLPFASFAAAHPRFSEDVLDALSAERSVLPARGGGRNRPRGGACTDRRGHRPRSRRHRRLAPRTPSRSTRYGAAAGGSTSSSRRWAGSIGCGVGASVSVASLLDASDGPAASRTMNGPLRRRGCFGELELAVDLAHPRIVRDVAGPRAGERRVEHLQRADVAQQIVAPATGGSDRLYPARSQPLSISCPALLIPNRCGSTTRIRSPYSNITSERRRTAAHSCSRSSVASIVAPRKAATFRCEKRTATTHDNGRVPPGRHLDRVAPESPDEHRDPTVRRAPTTYAARIGCANLSRDPACGKRCATRASLHRT